MKRIILTITLLLATLIFVQANELEENFIERFKATVTAESMFPDKLDAIWSVDVATTHYVMYQQVRNSIKDAMLRGIEKIEIVDFSIPEGTPKNKLEGVAYEYKPTPTKLLSVTYSKKMEGVSFQWSWPLGQVDGQLYLVELSPVDQGGVRQ